MVGDAINWKMDTGYTNLRRGDNKFGFRHVEIELPFQLVTFHLHVDEYTDMLASL